MKGSVFSVLNAVLLLCLLGAGAAATTTSKEGSREIEAKVALESSLEKRLQSVLREALGTNDLIVIVNVALNPKPPRTTPRSCRASGSSRLKPIPRNRR